MKLLLAFARGTRGVRRAVGRKTAGGFALSAETWAARSSRMNQNIWRERKWR